MTKELIDANNIPHAKSTTWAYDPDGGNYVLVLEDAEGKPFAALSGCVHCWAGLVGGLFEAIEMGPAAANDNGTIQ